MATDMVLNIFWTVAGNPGTFGVKFLKLHTYSSFPLCFFKMTSKMERMVLINEGKMWTTQLKREISDLKKNYGMQLWNATLWWWIIQMELYRKKYKGEQEKEEETNGVTLHQIIIQQLKKNEKQRNGTTMQIMQRREWQKIKRIQNQTKRRKAQTKACQMFTFVIFSKLMVWLQEF